MNAKDLYIRATELYAEGKIGEAHMCALTSVRADPGLAGSWYHLGLCLANSKLYVAATEAFRRAQALMGHLPAKDRAVVATNRGWYANLSGDLETAEEQLRLATTLADDLPLGWTNLSQVLFYQKKDIEALECAKKGFDRSGGGAVNMLGLAFAHFFNRQIREGFFYYEGRFERELPDFLKYPYPMWRGEAVDTLFVQAEQGLGDEIMMLRFLPEAAKRAKRVEFFVQKELLRIAKKIAPANVKVSGLPAVLPRADAWCPSMSLPIALEIDEMALGRFSRPYIKSANLLAFGEGLQVGLVWAGNPAKDGDRHRSLLLTDLLPLMQEFSCHSLQVGAHAQDINTFGFQAFLRDHSSEIADMSDTADIIDALDVVVACDTSVAHLAGAMGKPVLLLINQTGQDWRWMHDREDSPWYPSVKIFRRGASEGNWDNVLLGVMSDLREKRDAHSTNLPRGAGSPVEPALQVTGLSNERPLAAGDRRCYPG